MSSGKGSAGGGGGGGGWLHTLLIIIGAIFAGYLGIKITFWLLKMTFWVAAIGGVGWLVYQIATGKLGSDQRSDVDDTGSRALPPGDDDFADEGAGRGARAGAEDPLAELQATLRELEDLKRQRGE